MHIANKKFFVAVLFATFIYGCSTHKTALRNTNLSGECKFDLCSPYYLLNFVDVSQIGCQKLRERLPEACALAVSGSADAAWTKVADLAADNSCTNDFNSLLALTVLLGGYLDSANWFVKMRFGSSYQSLAKRLYQVAPSNPLAQALFGVLLLQAPESFGGDKLRGINLVKQAAQQRPNLPVVLYGLWYGAAATGKEQAAVKFAVEYLKMCPSRSDIADWCRQRGGCQDGQ